MELDIPTWVIVLILLIIIIVVINFLSARSDAFAEEIRKSKVIDELRRRGYQNTAVLDEGADYWFEKKYPTQKGLH